MSDFIHIVCLDTPAPPNYGGAIDMYYKITSLAALGKKIILHYFDYKPGRNAEGLEPYCIEIHAYKRKTFAGSLFLSTPYIIGSRINNTLVKRLNEDDYPILLEGLHCCGILPYLNNPRRVVLRMHNDEPNYYQSLASLETNPFKKIYFLREASLLKRYQTRLQKDLKIACLSETDIAALKSEYGFSNLYFISCFISWQSVKSKEGKGNYCLYHGNMAVSENEAAARWLINNVFSKSSIPFVIAGNGVSNKLATAVQQYKNIRLIPQPPMDELNALIRDAHINILPSINNTGVKLKLLHALFEGRFCVTNTNGIKGSRISSNVHVANEPIEYIQLIQQLFAKDFTQQDILERKGILATYSNPLNAQKLSALMELTVPM
jgi:glycosyltransferase involved in cell wall biosynthesis